MGWPTGRSPELGARAETASARAMTSGPEGRRHNGAPATTKTTRTTTNVHPDPVGLMLTGLRAPSTAWLGDSVLCDPIDGGERRRLVPPHFRFGLA